MDYKEYKPGPIGKERSLKNRKAAKDVRQSDGEGLDKSCAGGGRDRDSNSPIKDKVPELGGDIEGMITAPSAEYPSSSKVRSILLLHNLHAIINVLWKFVESFSTRRILIKLSIFFSFFLMCRNR